MSGRKLIQFLLEKNEFKIFITFFILFSYFAQWNDEWDFNSSLALIRAIVEEKRFEIDSYHNTTLVKIFSNGHYYSGTTPGLSFLMSWIYVINNKLLSIFREEIVLIISSNVLLGALSCVLMYKLLKIYSKNETHRLIITLIYGLATPIFPYSIGFYTYTPSLLFILLSLSLLVKEEVNGKNKKNIFLAGIFYGMSSVIHWVPIFLSPLFLIFIFKINKTLTIYFFITLLLGFLPMILYNFLINGFEIIYRPLYYFGIKNEITDFDFWKGGSWNPPHVSLVKILPRVLFYPWNGLFFYYPILLLSIIGIINLCLKKKKEGFFICGIFILMYIYSLYRWWGDFSFGPRRFIFVVPFLMIGLSQIVEKINLKYFLPTLIFSIFVNLLSLQSWTSLEVELGSDPSKVYLEKVESFKPLKNILVDKYLPSFMKNGPRSPLFENIFFKKEVDVRLNEDVKIPFLSLIPVCFFIILIWSKPIIVSK